MSVTLSDLRSMLRNEISDLDPTPTYQTFEDDELDEIIEQAVKEYSKKRPMTKYHTVNILADTGSYNLPEDFLFEIYVPLADSWNYEEGLRNTPQGLVPLPQSWQAPSEYLIQGDQIAFSPTPTTSFDLDMKYAARHLLVTDTYSTLPVKDQDLVVLKAHAICMRRLATDSAKLFKYTAGDTTIDKTTRKKQYAERAKELNDEWNDKIDIAVGARS